MTNIILSGAGGKMGSFISALAQNDESFNIVAGIDPRQTSASFPVYESPEMISESADVIVDFSHHSALPKLLEYAQKRSLGLVLSTTGHTDEEKALIAEAKKNIPIFYSANMSLGVNVICELAKKAAVLLDGWDIEIIEKHHSEKLDAPSGTALLIADNIKSALPYDPEYVYDRHLRREKRPKQEIGIHAIRGGTIVGEHEILFAGHDEVITVSHSASSRQVFAAGALRAAEFIKGRTPGIYDMSALISHYIG